MKTLVRYILLSIIIFLSSCTPKSDDLGCYSSQHVIVQTSTVNVLWAKPNIYIMNEKNGTMMIAGANRVFIEAKTRAGKSVLGNFDILAYDTSNGNLLWDKRIHSPSLVAIDNSTLYYASLDKVTLLAGDTGGILQEVMLPNGGNILSLQVRAGNIYSYTNSGRFYVYDAEEKLVNATEPDFTRTPILIDQGILYIGEPDGFKAIDQETGQMLWVTELEQGVAKGLVFTEKMIFFRGGDVPYPGNLYALDKTTGKLAWKKDLDVISNVEVQGPRIYVLTIDGYLLILDQKTGEVIEKIELSSRPFIVYDTLLEKLVGGYYIATDPANHVVIVSLGDSCQLFALQVNE